MSLNFKCRPKCFINNWEGLTSKDNVILWENDSVNFCIRVDGWLPDEAIFHCFLLSFQRQLELY